MSLFVLLFNWEFTTLALNIFIFEISAVISGFILFYAMIMLFFAGAFCGVIYFGCLSIGTLFGWGALLYQNYI